MTKTDKIIFWSTIFFALILLLFSNVLCKTTGRRIVTIELDGRTYASYSMDSLSDCRTIEIKDDRGYTKIEISQDYAKIIDSDCNDKRCIGEIHNSGDILVCIPHRLVMKIEGDGGADGFAY